MLFRSEQDEITYETSGYGMEVDDVLRSTQHSKDIVDAVKKRLDAVYELIGNEEFDRAEVKINELEQMLGDSHPELNKVKTAYVFEKAVSGDGS